ncbi:hypothetical protein [Streptomyces sp. NPDC002187]|uniref:hypothetical protein n=1 Tax=Streptomyces sp. NPDC002187 TaxID=3364637 RepID=UPI0036A4B674
MSGGRRRRGKLLVGAVAGAVLATGIGLYATDSWPFRNAYCWGAWQENSGAYFLGEDALAKSGSERRGTESAPPSAERQNATCTVEVSSTVDDSDSDEPLTFKESVTVEYGPVPAEAGKRRAWMARYFHGSASPLPDALDGLVGSDRAMLVLPETCDVDGRPSVVTIRSESWGDGHLGRRAMPFSIGTRPDVARMLLEVANAGMEKAGCAPDDPLRMTSPMVTVAEDDESAREPLCRIPGVTFEFGEGARYRQQVGAVNDELQTCSVVWSSRGEPDEPAAQYVMASAPRMAALFAGLPEGADEGLVRATCNGRKTVFYADVRGGLRSSASPSLDGAFANFVESVGNRIGCGTGGEA